MKCILCCIFNQDKHVDMFYLLLESILTYGNLDDNTIIMEMYKKMKAFGKGHYEIIGKHNIIAWFGSREHDIIFNEDYTSFTSTRKDYLQIVIGNLEKL